MKTCSNANLFGQCQLCYRYSGDEQREIREALRHRVSKALEPLDKARKKAATKQVSRRERTARQAQKREAEATGAKEK